MTIEQTGSTAKELTPMRPTIGDKLRRFSQKALPPALVFVGLVIVWELAIALLDVPSFILPTPRAVATTFINGITTGVYFTDIAVTGFEAVTGFLAGSLLGITLGTVIVLFPIMERLVYPYVVALQTVPKVAIAPLLVVWFGFGLTSKVVIVGLVSLFPVLVNMIAGLRSVDEERVDLLSALSASRWQIFWHLQLPGSMPFLFAGLNTAIVLSVIGAIVGEFVGATQGIGFRILQANYALDIAGAFSLFVVLSIMGLTMHSTLKFIERRVVFWARPRSDQGQS